MNPAVMPTYGRTDVQFVRGEGAWLIDHQGERYLDGLSGLGVVALGHANPAVAQALSEQSQQLLHTSNLYRIPGQEHLAERLAKLSGMDNMFFGNSGAEACECAIKIATEAQAHQPVWEHIGSDRAIEVAVAFSTNTKRQFLQPFRKHSGFKCLVVEIAT